MKGGPGASTVDFDKEYDTDTISLTSTVTNSGGEFFVVESIVADGVVQDEKYPEGINAYLTKWEGYDWAEYD